MTAHNNRQNDDNFCLCGQNKSGNERLMLILIIGLLHSLELDLITVSEFHATLSNPYTLSQIEKLNFDPALIDLLHRSLFLEDIEDLFPKEKLIKNILELKKLAENILLESAFNPWVENKWLSLGLQLLAKNG